MAVGDFDQNLGKLVDTCTKLGVILDFDGTLSFLAQKPALAILPPETRKVLERLSQFSDCKITIISGRNIEDLQRKVKSFFFKAGLDIKMSIHRIVKGLQTIDQNTTTTKNVLI